MSSNQKRRIRLRPRRLSLTLTHLSFRRARVSRLLQSMIILYDVAWPTNLLTTVPRLVLGCRITQASAYRFLSDKSPCFTSSIDRNMRG